MIIYAQRYQTFVNMSSSSAVNIVFTDGACSGNGKKKATGGFGIYIKQSIIGDNIRIMRKGEMMKLSLDEAIEEFPVTNIRMEGLAIITSIFLFTEQIIFERVQEDPVAHLNRFFMKEPSSLQLKYDPKELFVKDCAGATLTIVTDSKFWMDVIQKWMAGWIRKNQLLQKKNPDLLLLLHYFMSLMAHNNMKLELIHVRSHQKGARTEHADDNDIADVLATSAAALPDIEFHHG